MRKPEFSVVWRGMQMITYLIRHPFTIQPDNRTVERESVTTDYLHLDRVYIYLRQLFYNHAGLRSTASA